ncbi:MAG: RluA family pseudouridine synthase [Lachnospiraceae bacterium]|nr:RluA family pseudouridine synthase [Lachnospiraceae bacterium]
MDIERIVYEDDHILIYNKPAGLAVQTKRLTETDLETGIKNYLFAKYGHTPYLGLVHRLDQPVEGLVLFAKTKEAASFLGEKIGSDEVEKRYAAVVEGVPDPSEGRLEDYIVWDGRTNMAEVILPGSRTAGGRKAALSTLSYKVTEEGAFEGRRVSLVDIRLFSGRHHQIRAQLKNMGCPIIGDRKYNDISPGPTGVSFPALAAVKMVFPHPVTGRRIEAAIEPSNPVFEIFDHFQKK